VSRALRFWVLGLGLAGVAALLLAAFLDLPAFGAAEHPYRDAAVAASVDRASPNVISSINFDQRALDTLIEETILFGSVLAVAALLRPSDEEHLHRPPEGRGPLEGTRTVGYLLLPLTLVIGINLVVHGHLTPGGGFQGGIVLSTGLHLVYVAGRFRSLERLRPVPLFEYAEAAGTAAFAAAGLAILAGSGAFLANVLPLGTFGQLLSAGTVPLLNVVVGIGVGSGGVVLVSQFLQQLLLVTRDDSAKASSGTATNDEPAGRS
jgi:multicomponent Na+:H+ antiporter subunit B